MSSKKVIIQSMNHVLGAQIIMLGEAIIKKLKVPTTTIIVRYGSMKHTANVVSVPRSNTIRLHESICSRWAIPNGMSLRAQYRARSQTLVLGPILGVMIGSLSSDMSKPFGTTTSFCKELSDAIQVQGGCIYFFTPKSIHLKEERIRGVYYAAGWRKGTFPIPDVVYNRLMSRKLEHKPSVQHFLKEVKSRYGSKVFNERYLDKNEVFSSLNRITKLQRYLPESHAFSQFSTLKSMCRKYETVFLKPVRGSLGKGIVKIKRMAGGKYECHYSHMSGTRIVTYQGMTNVYNAIVGKAKSTRFQIQQGISLIRINGRTVDFRALIHKNGKGQWSVTSIVARIASNHHFVSNLARGGRLSPVATALSHARVSSPKTVKARLTKAALDIASGIEEQVPAQFGELGIDLAVDVRGKVWLIEVNSKPAKNDDTPLSKSKIRPSVRQLLAYTRYLSGIV